MMNTSEKHLRIATDDTLRETISHGNDNYPFSYYLEDIWRFDFHCLDWHWHHELEFLSVTEGWINCRVGQEVFRLHEGYGLFVNSGTLHRYEATDKALIPNIVFSPTLLAAEESLIYTKYIQPVIHSAPACQILDPHIKWQNDILKLLTSTYKLQRSDTPDELQTIQFLMKIWELLYRHLDPVTDLTANRHINHQQAQLQIMMQYIHDHYREPVTLAGIASAASLSKSSALNVFQTGIHTSPVSYLIQYRLMCAAKLLRTTEKPISTIAEETGFSDSGYFCRKFKERYHITPNTYRSK